MGTMNLFDLCRARLHDIFSKTNWLIEFMRTLLYSLVLRKLGECNENLVKSTFVKKIYISSSSIIPFLM